jgi:hypothetical protein
MAIQLPEGWKKEDAPALGVVVSAPANFGGGGHVTIDEKRRNFTLGQCQVFRRGDYEGRGWKERLYNDAISHLKSVLTS